MITNMAESNSSSESSTSASDSSDFEGAIGADLSGDEIEPFRGIEPWRFEPPGRATETQEREEDIEPPRRRCDIDSEEW